MGRVLIIAKREIQSLFFSWIAYGVLCLFLFLMGVIFTLPVLRVFVPGEVIELRKFTDYSRFALFFVVPMLTMSMFSDEYRTGRIETLRTSPITEFDLVMGKFIGAMGFYMLLVMSTLIYLGILVSFGKPDLGQVLSCYLGMTLMGCMFVAVGLFCSSITKEPILAALLSMLMLFVLTISDLLASKLPMELALIGNWKMPVRHVVEYMTVGSHIGDFTRGSVELGSTMYFAGIAALFLFWTYLVLESKKWR